MSGVSGPIDLASTRVHQETRYTTSRSTITGDKLRKPTSTTTLAQGNAASYECSQIHLTCGVTRRWTNPLPGSSSTSAKTTCQVYPAAHTPWSFTVTRGDALVGQPVAGKQPHRCEDRTTVKPLQVDTRSFQHQHPSIMWGDAMADQPVAGKQLRRCEDHMMDGYCAGATLWLTRVRGDALVDQPVAGKQLHRCEDRTIVSQMSIASKHASAADPLERVCPGDRWPQHDWRRAKAHCDKGFHTKTTRTKYDLVIDPPQPRPHADPASLEPEEEDGAEAFAACGASADLEGA